VIDVDSKNNQIYLVKTNTK